MRDLVWQRADTVVWLDLPRATVMRQVVARTLRRMASGEELWNTNREHWRSLVDPDESIIAWAWNNHAKYRNRYAAAARDPQYAHLIFIRLGARSEIDRFLRSMRAR